MKTLGLIGGISWVSTIDYYRLINEGINARLGGMNFSRCIIHSMNYADIKRNNENGDWNATLNLLAEAAENMKQGGAEALVLCANTMHKIADELEARIGLPVIHIAKVTTAEIEKQKLTKVALLGTKFTMEMDFFKSKLLAKNISVMIPNDEDREFVHWTIFEELGRGIINPETKQRYIRIINSLTDGGAQGVILGCTEIPLLIQQEDVSIPVFDTTAIHAAAAVEFSLS
ncbi:MAG TPA: aspartate/glutamate racemase family protein [Bacteroidia bacterium]|nr:aspartate/glutamate racemase family protein [Bacteroidia bacterium]